MKNQISHNYQNFQFEYTPWGYAKRYLGQSGADNKRHCTVEIKRLDNKAVVIVAEADDKLSKRAKKANLADISFQLEHQGYFRNPHIFSQNIAWYKRDTDWRGQNVLRHVFITRDVHRFPSTKVYFWGKVVLP